jgi:predicted nuclease of predicted toxin-antitoxin system
VKFLVDAQLPPALAELLAAAGHEAWHVEDIGLRFAADFSIWQHALELSAVILTKDEDFARHFHQSRKAPVIVWLRIGNCSRRALLQWFTPLLPEISQRIREGHRLIEVR